jgi:hypothetical protein
MCVSDLNNTKLGDATAVQKDNIVLKMTCDKTINNLIKKGKNFKIFHSDFEITFLFLAFEKKRSICDVGALKWLQKITIQMSASSYQQKRKDYLLL